MHFQDLFNNPSYYYRNTPPPHFPFFPSLNCPFSDSFAIPPPYFMPPPLSPFDPRLQTNQLTPMLMCQTNNYYGSNINMPEPYTNPFF